MRYPQASKDLPHVEQLNFHEQRGIYDSIEIPIEAPWLT